MILAKIGPWTKRNSRRFCSFSSSTLVPGMSLGMRLRLWANWSSDLASVSSRVGGGGGGGAVDTNVLLMGRPARCGLEYVAGLNSKAARRSEQQPGRRKPRRAFLIFPNLLI